MKFLKGLALSILSLLLFLSLSILGLALTLNYTVLNPDFAVSQVERLDISSLAKEVLSQKVPEEGKFTADFLEDAIDDLEPWIKEQMRTVIYDSYDYLLGKSQSLNVVISLEPMKKSLKETMRKTILQSPPPELAGLPPALIEQHFDEFYQQFSEHIPSTFKFDESSLGPEAISKLEQVRQATGYFQNGYRVGFILISYKTLFGFILLLILCTILIHHQVRGSTRSLGTTFLSYGVIEYAGIFAAKYFVGKRLAQLDIPTYLKGWLPQFIGDFLSPLEMFSIGILASGIALIIVSFVYKPREPSL